MIETKERFYALSAIASEYGKSEKWLICFLLQQQFLKEATDGGYEVEPGLLKDGLVVETADLPDEELDCYLWTPKGYSFLRQSLSQRDISVTDILLDDILPFHTGGSHPFEVVDDDDMHNLEDDIRENGQLEPIIVRKDARHT